MIHDDTLHVALHLFPGSFSIHLGFFDSLGVPGGSPAPRNEFLDFNAIAGTTCSHFIIIWLDVLLSLIMIATAPTLYDDELEEEVHYDVGTDPGCTPETLLDFLRQVWRDGQRSPTLAECKAKFSGILAPMFMGWELEKRGLLKDGKPKM